MRTRKDDDEWRNRVEPFEEDMRFQRRDWMFERVGWGILYLIALLALAGLFSVGPLSVTVAGSPSANLKVEYQRFHRNGSLADMVLRINSTDDSTVHLHLNTEFMEAFMIEGMWPQPILSAGDADGVEFIYESSRSRHFSIYVSLRPSRLGSVTAQARLRGQEAVSFHLFVYP